MASILLLLHLLPSFGTKLDRKVKKNDVLAFQVKTDYLALKNILFGSWLKIKLNEWH